MYILYKYLYKNSIYIPIFLKGHVPNVIEHYS